MKRMRGFLPILAAVLGVLAADGVAEASITVQWVRVQPDPTATTGVNILADNGWQCWLLVATADATSRTVGGWDLWTPVSTPSHPTSNHTGHDWGIFAYSGSVIAQRWGVDADSGVLVASNFGTSPTLATPISATLARSPDSFFFTSGAFASAAAPSEDNNLASGTNPPYDRNPVPDNLGGAFDTGVGASMKAAGSVQASSQRQTQVIAQVWIPVAFGSLQAWGAVADGTDRANLSYFVPGFFTPPDPAEPGSLAMLGIAGVLLFRRRRLTCSH